MSHHYRNRPLSIAFFVPLFLFAAAEAAAEHSRWYLAGKAGWTDAEATFGKRWPKSFQGDHASASIEVGYALNPYLAFQAGYHDLGEFEGENVPCPENSDICATFILDAPVAPPDPKLICADPPGCPFPLPLTTSLMRADVSALSLTAVPRWPFNDRFSAFGKLGVIDWDSDLSVVSDSGRFESFSNQDLLTGVGLQYDFPRGLGLVAEYQRFDLDLDSVSFGTTWRF